MTKQIALTQGLFALIDDNDLEKVSPLKWFAVRGGKSFYAATAGRVFLHRFLLNAPAGVEVDHKNGDPLDNRRENLRLCSHKENLRNQKKQEDTSSQFKGVYLASNGFWRALIEGDGEKLDLGGFESEHKAARQYDRAARIFFGQFAKTNEELGLFETLPDRPYQPKSKRALKAKLAKARAEARVQASATAFH